MNGNRSYLLLQSIEKVEEFDFGNPLLVWFHSALKHHPHFIIDNLSDAVTLSYAKQFIDQADELMIICDETNSESLGSLLPVLNQCVKKKNTSLMCIGQSRRLAPFVKMMKGRVFESRSDLINHLTIDC